MTAWTLSYPSGFPLPACRAWTLAAGLYTFHLPPSLKNHPGLNVSCRWARLAPRAPAKIHADEHTHSHELLPSNRSLPGTGTISTASATLNLRHFKCLEAQPAPETLFRRWETGVHEGL